MMTTRERKYNDKREERMMTRERNDNHEREEIQ